MCDAVKSLGGDEPPGHEVEKRHESRKGVTRGKGRQDQFSALATVLPADYEDGRGGQGSAEPICENGDHGRGR